MVSVLISAVLLAAGPSLRLGTPKQLVTINNKKLLEHTLNTVRAASPGEIIVVLGLEADRIMNLVSLDDTRPVIVKPGARMSSSLRAGIRAVDSRSEAVLIVLVDMPFVSSRLLKRIIRSYERTRPRIVALSFKGTQAPPVLFDKSLFAELVNLRGDAGAKTVIERHGNEVKRLEVYDGRILMDVDTPADLRRVRRLFTTSRGTSYLRTRRQGAGGPVRSRQLAKPSHSLAP